MSSVNVIAKSSAFRKRVQIYSFQNIDHIDLMPFFVDCKSVFFAQTEIILQELGSLKVNATLEAQFIGAHGDDGDNNSPEIFTFYLQSAMKKLMPAMNISE